MNLKKLFLNHCEVNQYEINQDQLNIIENLKKFYLNHFYQTIIISEPFELRKEQKSKNKKK